jgi:hypothetical protein
MGTTAFPAQEADVAGVKGSTSLSVTRSNQAIVWNSIALARATQFQPPPPPGDHLGPLEYARAPVPVGHADWVTGITFSPGVRRLASSRYDGTVKICDRMRLSGLHSGEQLRRGEVGLTDRDSGAARPELQERAQSRRESA